MLLRNLISCLFLSLVISANAQVVSQYHIDMYNGLPSNRVYSTLVDKHGYLWICTDKGVVRYNGYEFKKYGFAEGLSNEDVWQMIEDDKGRIWFLSISDEMGYVKNNKYKKCYNAERGKALRPYSFQSYKDGILFLTPIGFGTLGLSVEKEDTLRNYGIEQAMITFSRAYLNKNNQLVLVIGGKIFRISKQKYGLKKELLWKTEDSLQAKLLPENGFLYKNYLVSYKPGENYIRLIDDAKATYKIIQLDTFCHREEQSKFMFNYGGYLYLLTKKNVYKIDSNMQIVTNYKISSLLNDSGVEGNVSYAVDDNFWGICTSTTTKGLFITNKTTKQFEKFSLCDLTNYNYIGEGFGNISFWQNNTENILAKINKNKKVIYYKHVPTNEIVKIVPVNRLYNLVLTTQNNYLLDTNGRFINIVADKMNYNLHGFDPVNKPMIKLSYRSWKDVIVDSFNKYYTAMSARGVCEYIVKGDSLVIVNSIDHDIYQKIIYDSSADLFWAYNNNKILVFNRKYKKVIISKEVLREHGIVNIESIFIDHKYHNVFIKDYDKLLVFNYANDTYKQLFKNYNLHNAIIYLHDDKLIALCKFGILFSKINGINDITNAIVYANNKDRYYNFIYDFSVSDNEILLKTDKGTYVVKIPSDSELLVGEFNNIPYKMLLSYTNGLYDLKQNDTFSIDQKNLRLLFDVVNPNGNGNVHYAYKLEDENWADLNSNELTLPRLQPGKYFRLSLNAFDDAWISDNKSIYLYIVPYWWQTTSGTRILWLAGIIVVILAGVFIVLITKRIVSRNNEKKNLQLGLELNAVYSQINPHFVFNTLNTAQYFIKKKKTDEAFVHINKFSRLLRSYIKASRNKFISIEEEAINLRNYVELQQERFEDRFDYKIVIDEGVDTKIRIPSLLLQPIVENAINHGLFHKETKGNLLIKIGYGRSKNEIICIIDDDGIGRKRSKQLNEESTIKRESYGDQLIKDLINVFNKYEKVSIEMEYFDKEAPLTGTTVRLIIKNPHYA